MSLVFVTGIPGSGKTTVMRELVRLGYEAYDTDEHGLTVWINKKTGEHIEENPAIQYGTPEWYDRYRWTILPDRIREKARQGNDKHTFFCGSPSNAREVLAMFDQVFCLVLDDETLRYRLLHRTGNDYGKEPGQLSEILGWNRSVEQDYTRLGATIIDAAGPVGEVVAQILTQFRLASSNAHEKKDV